MSKTLAQMLTDWRQIIAQPDETNSNFTNAQGIIWANDAYRRICTKLRNLPIKTRDYTVTGQTVTLNSATVTVDTARFDAMPADEFIQLEIINLDDLIALDPDWEAADTGIPKYLVRNATGTAVLYPPPNAANANSRTLRTHGLELPTELSATTDTPDLPGNLHDIFTHWMAGRAFQYLGKDEQAAQQFAMFNSLLKDGNQVSKEFSRSLKKWRWSDSLESY